MYLECLGLVLFWVGKRGKTQEVRNTILAFYISKIPSVPKIKDFPEFFIKYYKTLT